MKIKKKLTKGQCATVRCRRESEVIYSANGENLEMCAQHGAEYSDLGLEQRSTRPTAPVPEILEEPQALQLATDASREMTLTLEGSAFVAQLKADAEEHAETLIAVKTLTLESQEDYTEAEDMLAEIKGLHTNYETRRTSFTQPANAVLREFNSWFKPVQTALKAAEASLKGKLSAYVMAQRQEQQRLLEAAREAEAPGEIREALVEASEVIPESSTVSFIDHWVFEVENESKIPRDFLAPDEVKIAAVVKAMKDKTAIPGVRVWNQPTVRSKSK